MTGDRQSDWPGPSMVTGVERGWAWVEHLRAGGTTPWADFTGESTVSDPSASRDPFGVKMP